VVDESGNVGSSNFGLTKSFLSQTVSRMDIDSGNTRVGLVTYSGYVRERFKLNSYSSVASMQSAISSLNYSGGSTNATVALRHVRTSMLRPAAGDRSAVPNVVALVTAGGVTDDSNMQVRNGYNVILALVWLPCRLAHK